MGSKSQRAIASGWRGVVVVLLALGVLVRVVNLGQDVYWVDEVATSVRVSGYTRREVTQQVAMGEVLTVADLQGFQRLSPDRTWADTWYALSQSPEHAPLYFVLARVWAGWFGSSVVAMRSLSVVLSLLTLPGMYWLGRNLFKSDLIGWTSAGLLAISPFFVAYAQEARPYSLWMLLLVLLGGTLWRSFQSNRGWFWYFLTLTLSLYTSLLTFLVVVGQAAYIGAIALLNPPVEHLRRYLLGTGGAILAFSPWLWIVVSHWQTLHDNTTWMREPMEGWAIFAIWGYSLSVLVFDVPVSVDLSLATVAKGATALAVLTLMGYAVIALVRETPQRVGLFVLGLGLSTPLVLLAIDLLRQGQASATTRYLVPCQLGVLIAVAYLLGDRLSPTTPHHRQRRWQSMTAILISLSLMSCLIGVYRTPDYQKARNRANGAIATLINQADTSLLLAESALTMDILSLGHNLHPDTRIQLLPTSQLPADLPQCRDIFLLNPSEALQTALPPHAQLTPAYQPDLLTPDDIHLALWQLILPCN